MDARKRCERCNRLLHPEDEILLVRNLVTNTYHESEAGIPQADNQGWFAFGKACAAAVLKNGGICRRVAPHPLAGKVG